MHAEVLQGERADYGKGWSEKQLRHCLRLAETFPDEAMLSALQRALSWNHIKALIYTDDALILPRSRQRASSPSWLTRWLTFRSQPITPGSRLS
ncbi:DUF1016 N-terminal domain-containing protein [Ralstonia pseudosolanacearum]